MQCCLSRKLEAIAEASIVESEEVADGVALDLDADGRIVAMLLDASKHIASGAEFPTAAE